MLVYLFYIFIFYVIGVAIAVYQIRSYNKDKNCKWQKVESSFAFISWICVIGCTIMWIDAKFRKICHYDD